ncbi:S8/S53 family peptidase, partial [uncultured Planktosalinus sp.]|uniref:S8/S53 family peptidase n=1 Tax=uncultured Planktosalinus sp. TaxID=1810935 RepID=UPI0030D8E85D
FPIFFTLLCLPLLSISQENNFTFWFKINSTENIPVVVEDNGKKKLLFQDEDLTKFFESFEIFSFQKSFPSSRRELLIKVYEIETNNFSLMSEIELNYPDLFIDIEEKPEIQELYLPDDLGVIGGELQEQEELYFIGAPAAWDITKGDPVIQIGISESVNVNHEDLIGIANVLNGPIPTNFGSHGTRVALIAGANTDNSIGISSIGFNSSVVTKGSGANAVIELAQAGVPVINMSWGVCTTSQTTIDYYQEAMDEAYYDYGAILVAAAGNGSFSCPTLGPEALHYPAGCENVISVSTIGHLYPLGDPNPLHDNQKDKFEHSNSSNPVNTFNTDVDIVAPGRHILTQDGVNSDGVYSYGNGTSFAAPIISGTIGLMLSLNPCLELKEVESILKLTSKKVDTLSVNLPYYGKIGSGRLQADLAVKMVYDMITPTQIVKVENQEFSRWDFILESAPERIEMQNQIFEGVATATFKAKQSIELISDVDLKPSTLIRNPGFVDLIIDPELTLCPDKDIKGRKFLTKNRDKETFSEVKNAYAILYPNPNEGSFTISLKNFEIVDQVSIAIFNNFGEMVFIGKMSTLQKVINIPEIQSGLYFVRLNSSNLNARIKFIKI